MELIPTRREKTRRPSHDFTQKAYVVEGVHHFVRQVESGAESDYFLKMDVMLSEMKDEKAEQD